VSGAYSNTLGWWTVVRCDKLGEAVTADVEARNDDCLRTLLLGELVLLCSMLLLFFGEAAIPLSVFALDDHVGRCIREDPCEPRNRPDPRGDARTLLLVLEAADDELAK